jgi:hypothetical protein
MVNVSNGKNFKIITKNLVKSQALLPGFQKGKFHLIVGQPATRDMNVPIS